jgi:hypothetical protein
MGATAGHPLVGRSNEGPSPLIHLSQYDGFFREITNVIHH